MKIEELQNDIISNEELLEDISYNIKNLIWLRTALEVMGFMECDRWTYKRVCSDSLALCRNKRAILLLMICRGFQFAYKARSFRFSKSLRAVAMGLLWQHIWIS